jgi:magnesium transporter
MHVIELRDEAPRGRDRRVRRTQLRASVRQRTEHGFVEVRQRAESEPDLLMHGSGFILYALMDNIVDRYFPVVDALESELETLERRSSRGARRAPTSSRSTAQAQGDGGAPCGGAHDRGDPQALRRARAQVCAKTQDYFRDIHDHLLRLSSQLDGLRDMAITALQVNLSMITLAENEVMKRLASYGALVAVPTMIAGIYGMNFKHMPELDWMIGYPLSISLMVGIDVILWFKLRRIGWL